MKRTAPERPTANCPGPPWSMMCMHRTITGLSMPLMSRSFWLNHRGILPALQSESVWWLSNNSRSRFLPHNWSPCPVMQKTRVKTTWGRWEETGGADLSRTCEKEDIYMSKQLYGHKNILRDGFGELGTVSADGRLTVDCLTV